MNYADINVDKGLFSNLHQDIYFQGELEEGIKEKQFTFVEANNLQQRFVNSDNFTILELGFGAGINFLNTVQTFKLTNGKQLNYIAIEKHPINKQMLAQILSKHPNQPLVRQLLDNYNFQTTGFFTYHLDNILFNLIIGDVSEIKNLNSKIDCFFFDGFSPKQNPEMWSFEVFKDCSKIAKDKASFTTYSVANSVTEALLQNDFTIEKTQGFGAKKQMLKGFINKAHEPREFLNFKAQKTKPKPWFKIAPIKPRSDLKILIVGAGISGCSTANSFARRNLKVDLIEKMPEIARAGSGNPQGITYLKLPSEHKLISKLLLSGFNYTLNTLKSMDSRHFDGCSLLQLPENSNDEQRIIKISKLYPELVSLVNASQASEIAGIAINSNALHFKSAGWLSPRDLCRELIEHELITVSTNEELLELSEHLSQIKVITSKREDLYDIVILANAFEAQKFVPYLSLKTIRGQTTAMLANDISKQLQVVVCQNNYLTPSSKTTYQDNIINTMGATFDLNADMAFLSKEDDLHNIQAINNINQDLGRSFLEQFEKTGSLFSRSAFRVSSPDYFPIVGAVVYEEQFREAYNDLSKNSNAFIDKACPYIKGLFVNTAHGSRGMISAPLLSEALVSAVLSEHVNISNDIFNAVSPQRYIIKSLINGKKIPWT